MNMILNAIRGVHASPVNYGCREENFKVLREEAFFWAGYA
jgi:hypothetical protein